MIVFRIVKDKERAYDLSGAGAFKYGGRWNNRGTYMLYASENASLAYLEMLVHLSGNVLPSQLFVVSLEIKKGKLIHLLKDEDYPPHWQRLGNFENKMLGDKWINDNKYLGFKLKSAVNPFEYNYLLNPLFPDYLKLVKVISAVPISFDSRFVKRTGN